MTPHKCPICNGNGMVDAGFYNQTSGYWTSTEGTEACRACNGTGIVWEKPIEGVIYHPFEPNGIFSDGVLTTSDGGSLYREIEGEGE